MPLGGTSCTVTRAIPLELVVALEHGRDAELAPGLARVGLAPRVAGHGARRTHHHAARAREASDERVRQGQAEPVLLLVSGQAAEGQHAEAGDGNQEQQGRKG
jgi:hypothetical protein